MVHINPAPNPPNYFEAIFGTGNADTSHKEEDAVAVALDRAFDIQRAIGILAAAQGKNRHESKIMNDIIDTLSDIAEEIRSEIVDTASGINSTSPDPTPEYPEYLVTEEDYKNTPRGTIVAKNEEVPYVKLGNGLWQCATDMQDSDGMSHTSRRVLRWGGNA